MPYGSSPRNERTTDEYRNEGYEGYDDEYGGDIMEDVAAPLIGEEVVVEAASSERDHHNDHHGAAASSWWHRALPKRHCRRRRRRRTFLMYVTVIALAVTVATFSAGGATWSWERKWGLPSMSSMSMSSSMTMSSSSLLSVDETLRQLHHVRARFAAARATMHGHIVERYGTDVADRMFLLSNNSSASSSSSSSRGRLVLGDGPNGPDDKSGWNGLKRKITIKLLRVLRVRAAASSSSTDQNDVDDDSLLDGVPFVWVTSGNSVSAGHGNMADEAYTAVLARAVRPLFEASHMKFVGRNYGISGAASGPEIALCLEAKYGTDVDLLLWDFSLTDGRSYELSELFHHRTAMIRSRPVTLSMGRDDPGRTPILRALAEAGLPVLAMNETQFAEALSHVPDTWGMSQAEIDSMPTNVRNFKCQGRLEAGEPYCDEARFSMDRCPTRPWRVKWHPGWKWDAVNGYVMALFVADALEESLDELLAALEEWSDQEHGHGGGDDLLRSMEGRLLAEEGADFFGVVESPSLPVNSAMYHGNESFAPYLRDLYYRRPNYCRTAALPAESRYRGVMTEELDDPPNRTSFDFGVDPDTCAYGPATSESLPFDAGGDAMRLVCDSRHRDACYGAVDHVDYYLVVHNESAESAGGTWKRVTIPNDSERRYYGLPVLAPSDGGNFDDGKTAPLPLEGVVVFCSSEFGGQPAKAADVHFDLNDANGLLGSAVEMRVNGEPVTGLATLTMRGARVGQCHALLRGGDAGINDKNGRVRWDADPSGRYAVEVRVLTPGHYIRFSSFMVW